FNQRTTPEISGALTRISADVSQDQRSGQSYYVVRIGIDPEQVARLGQVKLVPGMPVEAFIKTYDRTVISYFTKPLHDQILRAFRERYPVVLPVLSCPPHRHGQHAGEIRFWSLSQERLALHHVVNGFGDIGRVIAHALKILCAKHQVRAKGHRDGLFHHISEKLLR